MEGEEEERHKGVADPPPPTASILRSIHLHFQRYFGHTCPLDPLALELDCMHLARDCEADMYAICFDARPSFDSVARNYLVT
jgi:hypothetical protein